MQKCNLPEVLPCAHAHGNTSNPSFLPDMVTMTLDIICLIQQTAYDVTETHTGPFVLV